MRVVWNLRFVAGVVKGHDFHQSRVLLLHARRGAECFLFAVGAAIGPLFVFVIEETGGSIGGG